jgi:hypothetical protein
VKTYTWKASENISSPVRMSVYNNMAGNVQDKVQRRADFVVVREGEKCQGSMMMIA